MSATKTVKVTFTAAELETIGRAAYRVWNDIAGDIFSAIAAEGRDTLPRDEVIELVLDASRLEEQLREQKVGRDLLDRVAADLYKTKHSAIEAHLTRNVFTYAHYA